MTKRKLSGHKLGCLLNDSESHWEDTCTCGGTAMTRIDELNTVIEAGIEAAQAVVDNWCEGDLAGAVNILEDWAVQAADWLPDND